jgi:anti-sigma regulatory factor (Ser/Thr protein kinase)
MKSLIVPGTAESLRIVSNFVLRTARQARLTARAAYGLRLAVDEIATNIVTHGYCQSGRQGPLRLKAEWDERRLAIYLEDKGVTYDPRQVEPPYDLHWPAEKRRVGGLGIFLALRNVDRFQYERLEDCNRSTFVVFMSRHRGRQKEEKRRTLRRLRR